jgi:hypothetical protein
MIARGADVALHDRGIPAAGALALMHRRQQGPRDRLGDAAPVRLATERGWGLLLPFAWRGRRARGVLGSERRATSSDCANRNDVDSGLEVVALGRVLAAILQAPKPHGPSQRYAKAGARPDRRALATGRKHLSGEGVSGPVPLVRSGGLAGVGGVRLDPVTPLAGVRFFVAQQALGAIDLGFCCAAQSSSDDRWRRTWSSCAARSFSASQRLPHPSRRCLLSRLLLTPSDACWVRRSRLTELSRSAAPPLQGRTRQIGAESRAVRALREIRWRRPNTRAVSRAGHLKSAWPGLPANPDKRA